MAPFGGWNKLRNERLFACALPIERWAAWRLGQTMLVGIACRRELPTKPVISFGFAGALHSGLPIATIVDATKVVDESGNVLWEGVPLGVRGARPVVIMAAERIINNSDERRDLCTRSGADVVDMESGIYARKGMFAGGLRVISDTPEAPLGSLPALWFGGPALWALANIRF